MLFDPGQRRWMKFTKPSSAGYIVALTGNSIDLYPATPLQYLERWNIHDSLFADTVELIGLAGRDYHRRIVIAQPDIIGEDPTWDEINDAFALRLRMRELVLNKQLGGYDSRAYFMGRIGVFDVRPANCVRTATGTVVPIDVIPQFFSRQDADILKKLVKQG